MNVLVSTTRMWNPGDEVIYLGVKHLLEARFGTVVPVLWNRNPGVHPYRADLDNSFDPSRHRLDVFDYFVSAGGPEWLGPRLSEIYSCLQETELPCVHLGIGLGAHALHIDADARRVFGDQTRLVTCRDRRTFEALQGVVDPDRLHVLPCPSLFSFIDRFRIPDTHQVRVVGINYQSSRMRYNNVGKGAFSACLEVYRRLLSEFDVRVICKYVNDFDEAVALFGPSRVRFSADINDYPAFYEEVDALIGTRVHGCMGAISCGKPAFLLDSEADVRRRGVREVMKVLDAAPSDPEGVVELLRTCDPQQVAERNRSYADKVKEDYLALLRALPEPASRPEAAPLTGWSAEQVIEELSARRAERGRAFGERVSSVARQVELAVEKVTRRMVR